jgi:hypothetical protein
LIWRILQAIDHLHAEGLYHFGDSLYYDYYRARGRAGDNAALISLLAARNLSCLMVGGDDPRVQHMTELLPVHLRDRWDIPEPKTRDVSNHLSGRGSWQTKSKIPMVEGDNVLLMATPSGFDVDGPSFQSESDIEMKVYMDEPNIQAESLSVKRAHSDEDFDGPVKSPTGLRGDTDMDRPSIQVGSLTGKRDDVRAQHPRSRSEPSTPLIPKTVHFTERKDNLGNVVLFEKTGRPRAMSGNADDTETETEGYDSVVNEGDLPSQFGLEIDVEQSSIIPVIDSTIFSNVLRRNIGGLGQVNPSHE